MAHIIGLTTIDGNKVMINADHIICWQATTLLDGRPATVVEMTGDITLTVSENIYEINERIDVIQAALETWANDE